MCGKGATNEIATVACRELGHAASGRRIKCQVYTCYNYMHTGSVFVESDTGGILQTIVPITRTNMMCTGFEDAISQCSFDGVDGDPTCDHTDDIVLVCSGK